jgi:alpha-beta hydrolase superfamily lysophospholipase
LLLATKTRGEWRLVTRRSGAYHMPRWRNDGHLEILCGSSGRWSRRICYPDDAEEANDPPWIAHTQASAAGTVYDYLRLPGSENRCAGVILLPRLHQQFLAGAQPFFFHHALFCIARELALEGFTVTVLNGPGAIGRGRSQRESAQSYFADIRSAIHDLAQSLRAENCYTIGVLAGSMAAVPLLRLLGPQTHFAACALVAPLLEASIPVTDPVRPDLLDDPLIEALDDAVGQVQTPTLVVYGARDEVVPLDQMSRLYRRAPSPGIVELSVLEDEGHIFKQMSSWRHTLSTVESFFSAHLAADGAPAEGRPHGRGA